MCVCVGVLAWGIDGREGGRVKRREVIGCSGGKWEEGGAEIGGDFHCGCSFRGLVLAVVAAI